MIRWQPDVGLKSFANEKIDEWKYHSKSSPLKIGESAVAMPEGRGRCVGTTVDQTGGPTIQLHPSVMHAPIRVTGIAITIKIAWAC